MSSSGTAGRNPDLILSPGIPDATAAAALLAEHNAVREGAQNPTPSPALPDLVWDENLAKVAYAWGQKCQATMTNGVVLDYNPNRTTDYAALGGTTNVGESIFAATGNFAVGNAFSMWTSEATNYTYATNTCASGKTCSHYTQIVWRATLRVGCAVVSCSSLNYPNTLICDYTPAGNMSGQKPY